MKYVECPTAGAIRDRFMHHARTIAITGKTYRLKGHAALAGKEDKNKKIRSKFNEPSTAESARRMARYPALLVLAPCL